MKIIGVDLSGPGDAADTVCMVFEETGSGLELGRPGAPYHPCDFVC